MPSAGPEQPERIVHDVFCDVAVAEGPHPIDDAVLAIEPAALQQAHRFDQRGADRHHAGHLEHFGVAARCAHALALEVGQGLERFAAGEHIGRRGPAGQHHRILLLQFLEARRAVEIHGFQRRRGRGNGIAFTENARAVDRINRRNDIWGIGDDAEPRLHQAVLDRGEGGLAVGDLAARDQFPLDRAVGVFFDVPEHLRHCHPVLVFLRRRPIAEDEVGGECRAAGQQRDRGRRRRERYETVERHRNSSL